MGIFSEDFYNSSSKKSVSKTKKEIPLLKDYAIDLEDGRLLYNHNEPYIVEGIDAVICLVWKILYTKKKNLSLNEGYIIYTDKYGSSIHILKGKTKSYADAIIYDMLWDCLVDGTYITGVFNVETELKNNGNYEISFSISTIYGSIIGSIFIEEDNSKILLWTDYDKNKLNNIIEKH